MKTTDVFFTSNVNLAFSLNSAPSYYSSSSSTNRICYVYYTGVQQNPRRKVPPKKAKKASQQRLRQYRVALSSRDFTAAARVSIVRLYNIVVVVFHFYTKCIHSTLHTASIPNRSLISIFQQPFNHLHYTTLFFLFRSVSRSTSTLKPIVGTYLSN